MRGRVSERVCACARTFIALCAQFAPAICSRIDPLAWARAMTSRFSFSRSSSISLGGSARLLSSSAVAIAARRSRARASSSSARASASCRRASNSVAVRMGDFCANCQGVHASQRRRGRRRAQPRAQRTSAGGGGGAPPRAQRTRATPPPPPHTHLQHALQLALGDGHHLGLAAWLLQLLRRRHRWAAAAAFERRRAARAARLRGRRRATARLEAGASKQRLVHKGVAGHDVGPGWWEAEGGVGVVAPRALRPRRRVPPSPHLRRLPLCGRAAAGEDAILRARGGGGRAAISCRARRSAGHAERCERRLGDQTSAPRARGSEGGWGKEAGESEGATGFRSLARATPARSFPSQAAVHT